MNRSRMLCAPPLVFALAALLAWLTESPPGEHSTSEVAKARSPRQRAVAKLNSDDPATALLKLERNLLHDVIPPAVHDKKGMEALVSDWGMSAIEYAFDWAEESPDEMFSWLVNHGPMRTNVPIDQRTSFTHILFEHWAEKDMASALAAVSTIPNREVRGQALLSSLEILCKSDPICARELMLQNLDLFPPEGQDHQFGSETKQPTFDMILSIPPGTERTHLLAELLTDMAGSYGIRNEAVSIWEKTPESLRREWVAAGFTSDRYNSEIFDGLAELMRENAESSGIPATAEKFIDAHGVDWAKRDLAGALGWAQTYLKGRSRAERSAGLFEFAAAQDFDAALGIWRTLPEGFLKIRAAEAISKGAPADRKAEAILIGK